MDCSQDIDAVLTAMVMLWVVCGPGPASRVCQDSQLPRRWCLSRCNSVERRWVRQQHERSRTVTSDELGQVHHSLPSRGQIPHRPRRLSTSQQICAVSRTWPHLPCRLHRRGVQWPRWWISTSSSFKRSAEIKVMMLPFARFVCSVFNCFKMLCLLALCFTYLSCCNAEIACWHRLFAVFMEYCCFLFSEIQALHLSIKISQIFRGPYWRSRLCYSVASVCRLSVKLCIVAKRCVVEQNLILRAYRKSYMRNRLVPKWMTLTFV